MYTTLLPGARKCLFNGSTLVSLTCGVGQRCFCTSQTQTISKQGSKIPLPSYSSSENPFRFKSIEVSDVSQDPKKALKKRRRQQKFDEIRQLSIRRKEYYAQKARRNAQILAQARGSDDSKLEKNTENDSSSYYKYNDSQFDDVNEVYPDIGDMNEMEMQDDDAIENENEIENEKDSESKNESEIEMKMGSETMNEDKSIVIDKFQGLGISNALCQALECMNINQPSSIQLNAIPHLLSKLGIASDYKVTSANNIFKRKKHLNEITMFSDATGTGKTLAYLLPIIDAIKRDEYIGEYYGNMDTNFTAQLKGQPIALRQGRPRCLILAPTRELCQQIRNVIKELNFYGQIGISSMELSAGTNSHKQLNQLRGGVDIVVGTPERVLKHLKMCQKFTKERGSNSGFYLTDCKYIVLDEGDVLLNEGFWDEYVKEILLFTGAFNAPIDMYETKRNNKTGKIEKVGKYDSQTLRKMYGNDTDLTQLFPLTMKERPVKTAAQLRKRMNFVICSATLTDDDVEKFCYQLGVGSDLKVIKGSSYHAIVPNMHLYFWDVYSQKLDKLQVLRALLRQDQIDYNSLLLKEFENTKDESLLEKKIVKKQLSDSKSDELSMPTQTIIFCRTKKSAASVGYYLEKYNYSFIMYFGVDTPFDRKTKYQDFIDGKASILVATDAAMRGLDIPSVNHVILFDFPHNSRQFLHRIGRTGRLSTKQTTPFTSNNDRTINTMQHVSKISALIDKKDRFFAGVLLTALNNGESIVDLTNHRQRYVVSPHLKMKTAASKYVENIKTNNEKKNYDLQLCSNKLVPFEHMAIRLKTENEHKNDKLFSNFFEKHHSHQRKLRKIIQSKHFRKEVNLMQKPRLWFYRKGGYTRVPFFGIKKRISRRIKRIKSEDKRKSIIMNYASDWVKHNRNREIK